VSTNDWRIGITPEGDEGSTYQADVYCNRCTEAIKKRIEKAGEAPEDPDDERSYDSDDYPKMVNLDDEASDSPQHCGAHEECLAAIKLPYGGKIGAWLGGSLTSEGVESTVDMVWNDLTSLQDHSRQVGRLWRKLYADDLSEFKGEPREVDGKGFKVERKNFTQKKFFVDLDSVYALGTVLIAGKQKIVVLRYKADPKGKFAKSPDTCTSFTQEEDWAGKDPQEVLKDVIEQEDWS
jgi:hypothetical protein